MAVAYNKRSCYCGDVRPTHAGQELILTGWVQKRRDLGGMVFIDLRDRTGLVQLKFNPETDPQAHEIAGKLRSEYCIAVRGEVDRRPEDMLNPKMATGEVEVNVRELEILSESATPVFEIEDDTKTNEETRLRYRYLDLRRPRMQDSLNKRHRIAKALRDYFDNHGFVEIETPFLTKSTPEGARDYLVPSRVHAGNFFALPQSPQLFKQLLMMSGFDRYVQIVRCFRDEDLRADRQPEFTQLDMEMSFVETDDVLNMVEGALAHVMKTVLDVEVPTPFPRMSYDEAMDRFGIDRPDTRYGLEITNVSEPCGKLGFKVFDEPLSKGGTVRCIVVPDGASMTRKETDTLTDDLKGIGAGGLPLVKVAAEIAEAIIALPAALVQFKIDQTKDEEALLLALQSLEDKVEQGQDSGVTEAQLTKAATDLVAALQAKLEFEDTEGEDAAKILTDWGVYLTSAITANASAEDAELEPPFEIEAIRALQP